MFVRELVALFGLFVVTDSLQCNMQNPVTPYNVQMCPATASQCLKFTCSVGGGGGQQITKGCYDPNNPAILCSTLTANCAQQGGSGQCYYCSNYDLCNGATSGSILTVILSLISIFFVSL